MQIQKVFRIRQEVTSKRLSFILKETQFKPSFPEFSVFPPHNFKELLFLRNDQQMNAQTW